MHYLHDSGVVLHFGNEAGSALSDWVIIDPQFLTKVSFLIALYCVFDSYLSPSSLSPSLLCISCNIGVCMRHHQKT